MSDADRAQDQEVARRMIERERAERAERLRELVRLDLRALHDTAEHLEMSTQQLRIIIDGGDPSATVIYAICDFYSVSANVVMHGLDTYDTDAFAVALDVVACSVLCNAIPSERKISPNPFAGEKLSPQARTKYAEAMSHHVSLSAFNIYEKVELNMRYKRLEERGEPHQNSKDYPDPWATSEADASPPDNVSRLPSRSGRESHNRPL